MRTRKPTHFARARSGRLAAVTVVVGLVVTGCGSRVPEDNVSQSAAVGVVGNGVPAAGTAQTAPATGGVAPAAPAAVPGSTKATGTATTPITGTTTTSSSNSGKSAGTAKTPAGANGTTPVAAGCAKQGPPVTIGQVGAFSGLVGANFPGAIKASYVWVNYMNAHGGIGCHPIRFIQVDTQSNPAVAQAAIERLVTKENAVALFSAFVPLEIAGFQAGVNKMKIATIGGDQATPEWQNSLYMFPVGGTARAAVAGSVKQAAEAGGKKIAVLYCVETTACGANFNNVIVKDGFAKKYGMDVVYTGSVSITQPDFTAQCQNAKNAGADVVAWGLDRAGLQRAAKSCAALSYWPKLPLIALQGTFNQEDPNIKKSGAFLSALTFPAVDVSTAATKAYHDAMAQYAPTAAIDSSGSQTWASGMMLAKVVENLGVEAQNRPLTRDDIMAGAAKIKNETLNGIIPPTTYRAGTTQAENLCYYDLQFNAGRFEAPRGLKYSCL